ncbi:MAG: DNA polymerase III subunit alpha [Sumerlaeia bacterium]
MNAADFKPSDFVHLHVHSEFSFLDGANRIGPMLDYVKSMGQEAVALTDHGVMCGVLDFYEKAKKKALKPIVGCELYITPNSRHTKTGGNLEKKNIHHLLLLAENLQGYQNLCKLSSIAHLEGYYYKPRIDFETLEKHKDGLIATSSCLAGLIPQSLLANDEKKARDYAGQFVDIFGPERFFMEIQDHGIPEQRETNPYIIDIAKKLGLKLIASNDAHYMRKQDAKMHDVLLCVQTGCRHADQNRMRFSGNEFYMKSAQEMAAVFGDIPESLLNTKLVAEMCNLEFPEKSYHLPRFPCPDGMDEKSLMRQNVWEGAAMRYRDGVTPEIKERIEFEIGVIERMGFSAYFLIVADFIAHARGIGIPVGPGRGSAAGSVVAYCLRITELDPLKHGLLFERFLNPDRLSMPDIDVDFCFERRGEVIEYVRRKYGADCVSQIITFGTMKAKAAVRDVGRVFENQNADRMARLIPGGDPKMTLKKAWDDTPELQQLVNSDPQVHQVWDYANQLEGMVRHASIHAAGLVISDKPLVEYCPLYQDTKEGSIPATQFTMTEVEESIGLLKMDFLGIKNLTIIKRVMDWVEEREGLKVEFDESKMDDPAAYEMLQKGQTLGVFQLEGEGITRLVKKMKPSNFNDLTALIALYRPGPLQAGMDTMYVERKHGRQEVTYDHPVLEPILGESYGTILYQEQVMRISRDLCGFTGGEADTLRKAMGKKKLDVMEKMKVKFIDGAKEKHGVDPSLSEAIWNNIVTFAGYGFNKSHSAAYAVLTYQTAYLRAHYPTYFMAALLTNELNGTTDAIAKYVSNCREMGIEVLPVDINRSIELFNPDGNKIYYALNGLKGVGEGFAKAVVAERAANGPFKSLQDLCVRMPKEELNSRVLECLTRVGAFDQLHPNRPALLAVLKDIMAVASDKARQDERGEFDMFDGGGGESELSILQSVQIPANLPDWDDREKALQEKEVLGLYLASHPLNRYRVEIASFGDHSAHKLENTALEAGENARTPVTIVGMLIDVETRTTRAGKMMHILKFEDFDGPFECIAWEEIYEDHRAVLELDTVVQVAGKISLRNGRLSFAADTFRRIEELRSSSRGIEVEIDAEALTEKGLVALRETCQKWFGADAKPVRIVIHHPGRDGREPVKAGFVASGSIKVAPKPEALAAIMALDGKPRVRYIPGPMPQRPNNNRRREWDNGNGRPSSFSPSYSGTA